MSPGWRAFREHAPPPFSQIATVTRTAYINTGPSANKGVWPKLTADNFSLYSDTAVAGGEHLS